MESGGRGGAHAPEGLYGQAVDEVDRPFGMDRAEAVGLSPVGSDLGEELVVGDAGARHKAELLADRALDGDRHLDAEGEPLLVDGHVEKGLVKADGLDHVGIAPEDLVDLTGDGLVVAHSSLDEDQFGTELARPRTRHGAVHAEAPRLVACRRNDAAPLSVSDRDRASPKLGAVTLLDRGIECVHVDVHDPARDVAHKREAFGPVSCGNACGN